MDAELAPFYAFGISRPYLGPGGNHSPTVSRAPRRPLAGVAAGTGIAVLATNVLTWLPLAGASGQSPLGRVFAVAVRQGQALRTGHRSARGVAQDAPFFTAARLERRAGALTKTVGSYKNEYVFLDAIRLTNIPESNSYGLSLTAHSRPYYSHRKTLRIVDKPCIIRTVALT